MIGEKPICFEIAFDSPLTDEIFVRQVSMSERFLKILLPEQVFHFVQTDLSEGQVQGQPFGCLIDLEAVLRQIAKPTRMVQLKSAS